MRVGAPCRCMRAGKLDEEEAAMYADILDGKAYYSDLCQGMCVNNQCVGGAMAPC